jgi:hypothetical protein
MEALYDRTGRTPKGTGLEKTVSNRVNAKLRPIPRVR